MIRNSRSHIQIHASMGFLNKQSSSLPLPFLKHLVRMFTLSSRCGLLSTALHHLGMTRKCVCSALIWVCMSAGAGAEARHLRSSAILRRESWESRSFLLPPQKSRSSQNQTRVWSSTVQLQINNQSPYILHF